MGKVRPLLFDVSNGGWVSILKAEDQGTIQRHRHASPVTAWTLDGAWGYRERDWVARAGSFAYEPAGHIHTLYIHPDAGKMNFGEGVRILHAFPTSHARSGITVPVSDAADVAALLEYPGAEPELAQAVQCVQAAETGTHNDRVHLRARDALQTVFIAHLAVPVASCFAAARAAHSIYPHVY